MGVVTWIGIGDLEIEVAEAARWLADEYNRKTVRLYDFADKESLGEARSPTDRVILEDLGRLVCVGASLTYQRGQTLLGSNGDVPWPTADTPPLAEIQGHGDEFYETPAIRDLWHLFRHWDEKTHLGFGTVGKLLHIKWPHVLPVTDDMFVGVYRRRAVQKHNDSDLIRAELGDKRRRTSTANVRAYWHAFRDDVMLADEGLTELRKDLRGRMGSCDDTHQRRHIERVRGLTDVRLLDALAWGLGSDAALRRKRRARQGS